MSHGRNWAAALVLVALAPALAGAQSFKLLAGTRAAPAINDTVTSFNAIAAVEQGQGAPIAFTAESTAVFNVGAYKNIVMFLRVIPVGGDTTTVATVAIMPKCVVWDGLTAWPDSLAAYPAAPPVAAGFGQSYPPAGSGLGVWPGEIVKTIDPWQGRAVATTGKSNRYFGQSTIAIDLSDEAAHTRQSCGFMQVRVRMLSYNTTVTKKAKIQAWVMGFN